MTKPKKFASGEFTSQNASITIQHNLGTKHILAFWMVKPGANANIYAQIMGVFVPKEVYEWGNWKNVQTGNEIIFEGFGKNASIGWQTPLGGNDTLSTSVYSTQYSYGTYDNLGFVNDGDTVTIVCNSRPVYADTTYQWFVIALD